MNIRDIALLLRAVEQDVAHPMDIMGVSSLGHALPHHLSFFSDMRFLSHLKETQAGAILIRPQDAHLTQKPKLIVSDPYDSLVTVILSMHLDSSSSQKQTFQGIHQTAYVSSTAQIHPEASIGAHCWIGDDVVLSRGAKLGVGCVLDRGVYVGEETVLESYVRVYPKVLIGSRVIVRDHAVLGSAGFGFLEQSDGSWKRIPQIGGVRIDDDVDIGALSTIDSGALEPTIIKQGVKIDHHVHIAHGVMIGEHTAIAAHTGIAGSAIIGKYCRLGGKTGIANHARLADRVYTAGDTNVSGHIRKSGVYGSAIDAHPIQIWRKNVGVFKVLSELLLRVRRLESQHKQNDSH